MLSTRLESSDPVERLVHVGDQIGQVLAAHRQPHHEVALRHRVGEGVQVAETHRDTGEFERLAERRHRLLPLAHAEGDHATEPIRHVLRSQLMGRVRAEADVAHPVDLGALSQQFGDRQPVLGVSLHAQRHRAHAASGKPGGEGRRAGAEGVHLNAGGAHVLRPAGDHAAHHVAVSADVLRGRVHDDIGAELERLEQRRGQERVVYDEFRIRPLRDLAQRPQIGETHVGVGQRFGEDHPGVRPHGGSNRPQIRDVDRGDLDTELCERLLDEHLGDHEQVVGDDQVRPGLQLAEQHRAAGPHARRARHRLLRPLESGHLLLEHADGGIRCARVEVGIRGAQHRRVHGVFLGLRRLEGESRRLIDRRVQRSGGRVDALACVDRSCHLVHSAQSSLDSDLQFCIVKFSFIY